METLHIAGLSCRLVEPEAVDAELERLYREFGSRGTAYAAEPRNVHLCFAGCSHCCERGAFFAVTLAEAVRWARAVSRLAEPMRTAVRGEAERLLLVQAEQFQRSGEAPDQPGRRDEELFSARVSRVAATGAACPLLQDHLCSVYEDRPFLCRAYGYPVDAYAVESDTAIAFRSLCHLYAGRELLGYVQARDLRAQLRDLSRRLAGNRDLGRFTSAEAILARLDSEPR